VTLKSVQRQTWAPPSATNIMVDIRIVSIGKRDAASTLATMVHTSTMRQHTRAHAVPHLPYTPSLPSIYSINHPYIVLCCFVLFCAVFCCFLLFFAVFCCFVLFCAVFCCFVLFFAVLCCFVLFCAVLCCFLLFFAVFLVLIEEGHGLFFMFLVCVVDACRHPSEESDP
jgi:hypothetical protein